MLAAIADGAGPPVRKPQPPRASVLDSAKVWIDAMLREDLTAPRKQRHTIRRIYRRLASMQGSPITGTPSIATKHGPS